MPKVISSEELDAVVAAVAGHEDGIGLEALSALLPDVPRRTLQRRLATLLQAERLVVAGHRRAGRYRVPEPARPIVPRPDSRAADLPADETYVPLSAGGEAVRRQVRRPLAERRPIGYNRNFLDQYQPNVTSYLPEAALQRLHEQGRSPVGGQAAGTYARHILNRLLVDLSWASSRLEGNTYTRLDTQNLIDFGMAAEGKDQLEAQMILNHKAAIEMIVENAEEIGFNAYTFCNLHALLSENLLLDPAASGRVRRIPVDIAGTVYQPTAIPQLLDECFHLILDKADAIRDPFEQSLFVMVHIPYLQPFEDVNKRVSRLGANISLIRSNLAPLSFVDVPERAYVEAMLGVYETNQIDLLVDVFVWAYERSSQRYTVLREALPKPDPLRLRYRAELREVVSAAVRGGVAVEPAPLRRLATTLVAEPDLSEFVAMAASDLHHLHEGNLARYGLRLSEYRAWKNSRAAAP